MDLEARPYRATLQQARSRATRKAIMEAAERLWRAKEFDQVAVGDVCREAGIAKGTFYLYFPKKEYLLVMLVFARMSPHQEEIERLVESSADTAELCDQAARLIAKRAKKMPRHLVRRGIEVALLHSREIAELPGGDRNWKRTLLPIFERAAARGEIGAGWDPVLIAGSLSWALTQGVLAWAYDLPPGRSIDAHLTERAELIANGASLPRRHIREDEARAAAN